MTEDFRRHDACWLTALIPYNGSVVALRVRPLDDLITFQATCPNLTIISHELANVRADGLPDSAYNDTLAGFDAEVLACISAVNGTPVIIETCSGKRNYYGYVADEAVVRKGFENLRQTYPQHALSLFFKVDPTWSFYNKYHSIFQW